MAQKVDYAELRKIYFNYQPEQGPSHSNELSELESYLDDHNKSRIHHLMKMASNGEETFRVSELEERLKDGYLHELEFKTHLSQQANETLNMLYEKYGRQIYIKIIQLIKDKELTQWNQLEDELSLENFEPLVKNMNAPLDNELKGQGSNGSLNNASDDFEYLDALVKQDYKRINRLQSDQGSISSIFGEIIENEQQCYSNYQDDIFEKNIELIYNSEIDLDHTEWRSQKDIEGAISDLAEVNTEMDKEQSTKLFSSRQDGLCSTSKNVKSLQYARGVTPSKLAQKMGQGVNLEIAQEMKEINSLELQREVAKFDCLNPSLQRAQMGEERVVIKKIIPKKTVKERFDSGFIILFLLVSNLVIISLMLFM